MENKNALTINNVRSIELEILDYVDKICEKNGLRYFLGWGTLLGAVRHNGFIPWDDDIDILVPFDDYERLIKIIQNENCRFKVLSPITTVDYYYPFSKIVDHNTIMVEKGCLPIQDLGVYIDIFPLYYLPDNRKKRDKTQKECWYYRQVWGHAIAWKRKKVNRGALYSAACFLCSVYGWRRAIKNLFKVARRYKGKSRYVADLLDCNTCYQAMPAEWFENSKYMPFEGKKYPVPVGWDEYLTLAYGEYMTLPPVEKRVSNHNFEVYRK